MLQHTTECYLDTNPVPLVVFVEFTTAESCFCTEFFSSDFIQSVFIVPKQVPGTGHYVKSVQTNSLLSILSLYQVYFGIL